MKKKNTGTERRRVVMIVEDFDFIRSLVGKYFHEDGYDIISAGNMHEAMAIAQREQPNAVIVDFDMVSSDPYLIVSILHNILPLSEIMLMNGRSRHCNMEEAKIAGANRILERSYDPSMFEEIAHNSMVSSFHS